MSTKAPEVSLSTDFQTCLMVGSVFCQLARLHHFSPFCLPSLVTHIDFHDNPVWLVDVFCGSLPSLLVNQIKFAERRFLVSIQFKKHSFSREFVGRRDG